MKTQITLPYGFLQSLPKKLVDELQTHAANFKHIKILTNHEYSCEVHARYTSRSVADTGQITLIDNCGDMFKCEIPGIEFRSDLVDEKVKLANDIFELKKKAAKLDSLEASLANIKGVIGELK